VLCVPDEEILDVFSESAENSSVLRQDVIFARFSLSLRNGTLRLLHSSQSPSLPSENGICFLKMLLLLSLLFFLTRDKSRVFKKN